MNTISKELINLRYLGSSIDEPKKLLQPITGYAYEPLLTLEEACEPLLNIIPHLRTYIWIAKENSKTPADDLTQEESAAIRLYTMQWGTSDSKVDQSLYAYLNRTLKESDRCKLRPWFRYLKLFLTALIKIPPSPRQIVWRGVHKNLVKDYPTGDHVTWWAFSSCTISMPVLESDLYLGKEGTRTIFSIDAINGRTIRAHSQFTTEDEILLLPGTYFVVKSILNPAADLYIVHLQQMIPPHVLLEPPFKDAEIFPISNTESIPENVYFRKHSQQLRPWYKKNRIHVSIAAAIALIIVVVLAAVLGTRNTTSTVTLVISTTTTNTTTANTGSFYYNGLLPVPVSVAEAFYAFDENLLDLFSRRNGEFIGRSINYVKGYVAYGQAIVLNQSITTQINVKPIIALNVNSSFTIEGFFMLLKTQISATIIQLMPNISMNLINGILSVSLGSNIIIPGSSVISTDQWHHFSFVYDSSQLTATISIDGIVDDTNSSIKPKLPSNTSDSTIIIGSGFDGYIDQLSISLTAKSQDAILWDATAMAYYPFDISWLTDRGPNGINASASKIITTFGWMLNAINFNVSGSYYATGEFTALGTPLNSFSIALWVRVEAQTGIFLTVANPYTCLLVLGFQSDNNVLVAYLPNATSSGNGVNIIGPKMPSNAWVNVAFTWSSQNRAKLYTSSFLQGSDGTATTLNNARGGNNSSPMTITLGTYSGPANCEGIQGIPSSKTFIGSLDELFVFSRELQLSDLQQLITPN
ncbi:unnamed protein product [Rotaria socialis]|uniref:NAD(P)(+)--arginine ADP-ribosyltransferase n=1 Tax=Rotaria socialis TaxID=392032 RepID=A0A820TWH7_9BILA|nr:unnamed protein product [Rotaria socialis]CAF4473101.1 unnamed protein product [Rotaria socialis]